MNFGKYDQNWYTVIAEFFRSLIGSLFLLLNVVPEEIFVKALFYTHLRRMFSEMKWIYLDVTPLLSIQYLERGLFGNDNRLHLQWCVCLWYCIEFPFRHIFQRIYERSTGQVLFSRHTGEQVPACELLSVTKFQLSNWNTQLWLCFEQLERINSGRFFTWKAKSSGGFHVWIYKKKKKWINKLINK